jgi:signal transduction histidine kinase
MLTNPAQTNTLLDAFEKFGSLSALALNTDNYAAPVGEALQSLVEYTGLPYAAVYLLIENNWRLGVKAGSAAIDKYLEPHVQQAAESNNALDSEIEASYVIPLRIPSGVVGALALGKPNPDKLSETDKRLYRSLAGTLAGVIATVSNAYNVHTVRAARLLDRRLSQLELIAQVSAAIAGNLNVDELLQNVSDLVKTRFGFYHAHIYLYDPKAELLVLSAGAGEIGRLMKEGGHSIRYDREYSLVARAARTGRGVIANDTRNETGFLPNPLLPNTRAELSVPMQLGATLIGVLDVQADEIGRFTEEDVRLQQILADQVAVAVQNARLVTDLQTNVANLEIVRQVATTTATILNVEEMLTRVCDQTKAGFGFYHAHIYLLDESGETLVLRAGAGDAGKMMKLGGHSIPVNRERSLVARAAREGAAVIVNDTKAALDHLPNPLLPQTRSEMAVPMLVGGVLIGVLDVQSDRENRFGERDIRLMEILGEQVSVATQNAKLYERELETSRELRQVDHLKSEFLASMSHELRTPLNSIIGYAEVLIDGIDGDLPEEAQIDVQAIYDSGQHLLNLINQILDLAKIEAGHMELDLEEVNLHEVAGEVERITQVLVKEKPVDLVFDIPESLPRVLADHQRLRQILNNLVSNAIKFTEKGAVHITAKLNETGDYATITVRDTGIGIAPEHIPVIFEQFRQVDNSSTRRFGGTGLGLPITLHLVQMHGGTIDVRSKQGEGSTFAFTIPVMRLTITGN